MKITSQLAERLKFLLNILQKDKIDVQAISTVTDVLSEVITIVEATPGATVEDALEIIDGLKSLDTLVKERFDFYGQPENMAVLRIETEVRSIRVTKQSNIDTEPTPSTNGNSAANDSDNMDAAFAKMKSPVWF